MNGSPGVLWQCPPKSIVVGMDFGDASARALAIAGFMAPIFGARIRVVHSERFEPPAYFTLEQIERLEAERRQSQAAAADHLARFAAVATSHRVHAVVVDEPPVDAILDASAAADLIVVGTHGRRGPGRWWLGSVAERIVRAATVPVLVTRAGDTSLRDLFGQIALVHDGPAFSAEARRCADHFAGLAGGEVIEAGAAAHCDAGVMQRASLVVMATGHDRPAWSLSDPVTRVLGACQRPVLFIPALSTHLARAHHER
ncbi:MAG: universal stress protein [Steroidobacteraceae bacterium]